MLIIIKHCLLFRNLHTRRFPVQVLIERGSKFWIFTKGTDATHAVFPVAEASL